ncbi:AI-2E family transporter [Fulvivirgaceae bacterium BMA12]|uniref:AI-2E family transporter n=1 Tax=Agaribacillus aureus TaxID=3051825 RepID=A0ABT8LBE2_9BACT|nr:AI-2E family transporter [Fulvivirgaceae bacterium BMA12]
MIKSHSSKLSPFLNKTVIYLLLGIAIFFFLSWYFSNITIYIVISLVLATILRPLTNYIAQTQFYKIKIPRIIAVILSFLLLVLVLGMFILLFVPLISEQIQVIANINYESLYQRMTRPLQGLEKYIIDNQLWDAKEGFLVEGLKENLLKLVAKTNLQEIINRVLSITGNVLVGILAVSFITFFFLFETGIRRRQLISIIPNGYFEVTISALFKIEKLLSNYLIGLLFQMICIFSIAAVGLSILGIKYALTIAVFAAVANLIPYAGPVLGASFGIIVGISTTGTFLNTQDYIFLLLKIGIVFSIVQITDNLVLQPLIFSKSVKAHPLEIFVIIFAGATVAGIVGMIVAIPFYTVLRVSVIELYKGFKQYRIFKLT